jgi:hypothetical protein
VDVRVVRCAVRFRAAQEPDNIRTGIVADNVFREFAGPVGTCDGEPLFPGSRCSLAGIRKRLGPCIHELEQVESAAGIRNADEDRLLREVQPGRGVERIGIGTDDPARIGPRELRNVREAIDGNRFGRRAWL